ncbi:MAG: hypothetical protein MJ093_04935 [Saccharofermentans sp.]|nr:hypothetical protein [Saccharofermentans sp.]
MKKGLVKKLSIVMSIIMMVLVFYTAGMPQTFTCEDNEEFLAQEKELELERQKVKDKIDPIFNQKISRIPLWFLYTFEYEEFSGGILTGLFAAVIAASVALIIYRRKPAVLLTICCVAIPILIYMAYNIATHPTFCK